MYKEITVDIMMLRETPIGPRMFSPEQIAEHVKDLSRCAQEQFVVLTFNTRNQLIDRHMVALGSLNSTIVHPREVFRVAILDSAASIVIIHNHPSGDPSPSANDIRITKKLIEASKIMEIQILDHVIIGRKNESGQNGFLSLRESGLCEFDKRD